MKEIKVTKNKSVFWDKTTIKEVISEEDESVENLEEIIADKVNKFSNFINSYFFEIENNTDIIEKKNQLDSLENNYYFKKWKANELFTLEDLNNFKFN